MTLRAKTFPILQFSIFFVFFILYSCEEENKNIINNEQFIEIYARLLIIHEMEINKDYHDKLVSEIYREFNISSDQIDSTIAYYNSNPKEWVEVLLKVRNYINEMNKDHPPKVEKSPDSRKFSTPDQKESSSKKLKKQRLQRQNLKKQEIKKQIKKEKILDIDDR